MKNITKSFRSVIGFTLITGIAISMLSCSNHKFSVELQVEKLNKNIQQMNDADSTAAVQLIQQKFQITDTVVRVDTVLHFQTDTVYQEIETNDLLWKQYLVGRWYDMSKKKPQYMDLKSNGYFEISGMPEEFRQQIAEGKVRFVQTWDVYSSLLVIRTRVSRNNKVKESMEFRRIKYLDKNLISICRIEDVENIKSFEEIPESFCATLQRNENN